MTEVEELEERLDVYLEAYENGKPIVSDEEFDILKRKLEKINPDSYFLQKIGNGTGNVEKLPYMLGSLKTHVGDELDKWLKKYPDSTEFILSHKLDGMAIECEYYNGKLTGAWQRGDGVEGENVTDKIMKISPTLHDVGNLKIKEYVKGELLLGCEPETIGFKNKRNAVAGILRKGKEHLDKLYLVFHSYVVDSSSLFFDTEEMRMSVLPKDATVRYLKTNKQDLLANAKLLMEEKTQYDKDGIVICVNKSMPENVKYPTNKIALKFNLMKVEATVKDVVWEISRTGKAIPVVHLFPVEIGGVTVSKATGFNARFIDDNCIGSGAKVILMRAGDVIPYIDEVISSKPYTLPNVCPECGEELSWDDTRVNIYCENNECTTQKRIAYFLEKLGLENFSLKMISSLNCGSVPEIYDLSNFDIRKIDGWANTSTEDFITQLVKIKHTTPVKLLAALGIDGLGESVAKLILEHHTFDEIIECSYTKNGYFIEALTKIKGIGDKKAYKIVDGIQSNYFLIKHLLNIGFTIEEKSDKLPLTGKSFCITGALSKPRKEFENLISTNGGDNVSAAKCQYLITNDTSTGSAKIQKALEKGIKIISEVEFLKMLN